MHARGSGQEVELVHSAAAATSGFRLKIDSCTGNAGAHAGNGRP